MTESVPESTRTGILCASRVVPPGSSGERAVSEATPSSGSPTSIVIRWEDQRRRWGFVGAYFGFAAVIGVVSLLSTAHNTKSSANAGGVLGTFLVAGLLAWRTAGWSLTAETDRVIVRNFWLTRRIPWKGIACLEDGWGTHGEWMLRLVLVDGSSISSTASSGHPEEMEASAGSHVVAASPQASTPSEKAPTW
jgi:hypothetical protein